MNPLIKRIAITFAILGIVPIFGLLLTYEIVGLEWISLMELQPSNRPMEAPLPLPKDSVPVEGAAYLSGTGAPENPIAADAASLERGKYYFNVNCALCHGAQGKGDGPQAQFFFRKPNDLTAAEAMSFSDGEIFLVISNGIPVVTGLTGGMPPLRENLAVADRWDVVNYVRSLQGR